jgi:hypothetical protein
MVSAQENARAFSIIEFGVLSRGMEITWTVASKVCKVWPPPEVVDRFPWELASPSRGDAHVRSVMELTGAMGALLLSLNQSQPDHSSDSYL